MSKNLKKIIGLAIGISIISGNLIPAYAADTSNGARAFTYGQNVQSTKPILTLSKLIDAAVDSSGTLDLKSEQIKYYKDQLEALKNSNSAQQVIGTQNKTTGDYLYDLLEYQKSQVAQSKDFLQDNITSSIKTQYNDIVSSQLDINKLKAQIDNTTKQINNAKLQQQLGLITSIDLQGTQIQLQTLIDSEKSAEQLLKAKKDYLDVLTGLSIDDYELDYTITYDDFKINGEVDAYLEDRLDEYFRINKDILKLSKDNFDDMNEVDEPSSVLPNKNQYNKADGSSDEDAYEKALNNYLAKWKNYTDYLGTKYSVASNQSAYNEGRKALKNALEICYANLITLEDQIATTRTQIDLNNKQIAVAKLQCDLGLITKTDYVTKQLTANDLDKKFRTLISSYETLKDDIQKPWILASSSSNGSSSSASSRS